MKNHLPSSKKSKAAKVHPQPVITPDDRLGPDEPLDDGTSAGKVESLTSGHRVASIEPNDEHNNEVLIEEGMQGYMHGSLTKPRKGIKKSETL